MSPAIQWSIVAAYIVGGIFCGKKLCRKIFDRLQARECHERKSGRRFE